MSGDRPYRSWAAALVAVLLLPLSWLYGSTVKALVSEWLSSADASYGVVVSAVAILVAWQRRAVFIASSTPDDPGAPGFFVAGFGVALYLAGFFGADVFLTRVSLVVVLVGGIWFLAGWRSLRVMAAPLLFLLIAIPLPALVVNQVTLPLQFVASGIAESALSLASVPVFRDGNVLVLQSASLEVAEACNGLRSLVSLGAIGILLAWATERTAPARAVLIAATVPLAILMNGLRIAATGMATEVWGEAAASGDWHTFTGWCTFVVSVFVLVSLQRGVERLRARRRPEWAAGVLAT